MARNVKSDDDTLLVEHYIRTGQIIPAGVYTISRTIEIARRSAVGAGREETVIRYGSPSPKGKK